MDVLENYLRNHWAGAAGGLDLAERVARTHRGSDVGKALADVAAQIREDRESLRELMSAVGATPEPVGPLLARTAERLGRLKPNGRLLRHSPVSAVLELEALRSAVTGKRCGWESLAALATTDPRLPVDRLAELQRRADDQLATLTDVHARLAVRRLHDDEGGTR